MQILEHQHRRTAFGDALEEGAPGGEELLAVAAGRVGEPQQVAERLLHPAAFLWLGDELAHRGGQFGARLGGILTLGDPRPHANHLPERPEGDPLTVGRGAALLPVDGGGQTVHVFEELPRETALADPGETGHRHQSDTLLSNGGVE